MGEPRSVEQGGACSSEACCAQPSDASGKNSCPVSGNHGQPVKWTTMAALSVGKVPPRQQVYLCLDEECEIVYFGDRGLVLRREDLHTVPGFKPGGSDLVCYCFLHSRTAIEREVRTFGRSPTIESIRTQTKEQNCACEFRNPTGKCCLRDLQQIVAEAAMKGAT